MAVDATARLYDVDEDTVVFKKLNRTQKYDQGLVTFRARRGKLIDLDKLHESLWATRLSGGTRSGLVQLEVVTIGSVVQEPEGPVLKVAGSDREFRLLKAPDAADVFQRLLKTVGSQTNLRFRIEGKIANYRGRWPNLLRKRLERVRSLQVTRFERLK